MSVNIINFKKKELPKHILSFCQDVINNPGKYSEIIIAYNFITSDGIEAQGYQSSLDDIRAEVGILECVKHQILDEWKECIKGNTLK
jgi:hypothetical protein